MFPVVVRDETVLKSKDYVFGIRDALTHTVRAYGRKSQKIIPSSGPEKLTGTNGDWNITEDGLIGPKGERLARHPGHVSYWFAWDGYLGVKSELYKTP